MDGKKGKNVDKKIKISNQKKFLKKEIKS